MDVSTLRLLQAVRAYEEDPPKGVPEDLLEAVAGLSERLEAPRLTEESPGERVVREVAEEASAAVNNGQGS